MAYCINHQEKTQFWDREVSNCSNEMVNLKQVCFDVMITSSSIESHVTVMLETYFGDRNVTKLIVVEMLRYDLQNISG